MLYIHPDECVDCGACEPVCPVEAIYYEDDLPDEWAGLLQGERRVLRRRRLARRRRQGRRHPQGPPDHRRSAAAGARVLSRGGSAATSQWADAPDYPWDAVAPYAERASAAPRRHRRSVDRLAGRSDAGRHRDALAAAADAHAYPQTVGTPALREAIVDWFARRRGVPGLTAANVLPTIGSKELVALLPLLLGLGPGDIVVHPRPPIPTYAVGARARRRATCTPATTRPIWPESTKLVWLNSPGNPDGRVLDVDALRRRGRAGPRARRGDRRRRVLRRAGLGRRRG